MSNIDFGSFIFGIFIMNISLLFGKMWAPDYYEYINLGTSFWTMLIISGIFSLLLIFRIKQSPSHKLSDKIDKRDKK